MKQLLNYCFALVMGTTLLASCSSGDDDDGWSENTTNDYIRIDNNINSITLSAGEKQRKISIYSNCSWTVSIDGWSSLGVDQTSGSGNVDIWLDTEENTTTSARNATLTFTSSGIKKTLTITQSAGELSLKASPSKYTFPADGGEYTFNIEGNTDWKVTEVPDWCEIVGEKEGKSGKSQLRVNAKENPYTTNQSGIIKIVGEMSTTIEVEQQGKAYFLTVNTNGYNVNALGGRREVVISCNGTWKINIDNDSWCHVDKTLGNGDTAGETVTITCDANPWLEERIVNVNIIAGNDAKHATITITQLSATKPVIDTPVAEIKSSTEMMLSADYTSMFNVTEYGFCYGREPQPTNKVKMGDSGSTNGTIQGTLKVEDGYTYYVRAYAVSAVGISYSNDITVEMKGAQPGKDDIPSPDV